MNKDLRDERKQSKENGKENRKNKENKDSTLITEFQKSRGKKANGKNEYTAK